METRTEVPQQQAPSQFQSPIQVNLGADTILMVGFMSWLFWEKILKEKIIEQFTKIFSTSKETESRIEDILAQIGILTNSSRVTLAVFHNGDMDHLGYHFDKISVINSYQSPELRSDYIPIKNLQLSKIEKEIKLLKDSKTWVSTDSNDPNLNQACKDYLMSRDIAKMANRMIRIGNVDIGILSIQYCKGHSTEFSCNVECTHKKEGVCPYSIWIEELYDEICMMMRERISNRNPIVKFFHKIYG